MASSFSGLIIADADFLAGLPDLRPGSPEAVAVATLAAAGRLVTIKEARDHAEESFQAVVNFPTYQAIGVLPSDRKIKALARSLASSMPKIGISRHYNFCDLVVAAAALDQAGAIATTAHRQHFYNGFRPPLKSQAYSVAGLTTL